MSKLKLTAPVTVAGGDIRGYYTDDGTVKIYLGIPYGKAPAGELRFREALPPEPWEGVRDCLTFGLSAVQQKQAPFFVWTEEFIIRDTGYGEDCLNLNIWTADDGQAGKPVLVYLHGGGFSTGGSSCEIYDGEAMARKGIVFLSFNHRVGTPGLYCSEELDAESPTGTSGSYTLLDELTLLRWIRDHIAAFGGDPKRVTLMGQSSGGAEINALCVSPLAKGLFSQAFVMGLSNYRMPTQPCDWETAAESKARRVFPELSLAQLREADPSLFLQGQPMQHLTMDGHVLDMNFNEGVDSGRTAGIRMLLEMVRDDAVVTDALTPSPARFPQRTR